MCSEAELPIPHSGLSAISRCDCYNTRHPIPISLELRVNYIFTNYIDLLPGVWYAQQSTSAMCFISPSRCAISALGVAEFSPPFRNQSRSLSCTVLAICQYWWDIVQFGFRRGWKWSTVIVNWMSLIYSLCNHRGKVKVTAQTPHWEMAFTMSTIILHECIEDM